MKAEGTRFPKKQRGQSLVEFAIMAIPMLLLLMGGNRYLTPNSVHEVTCTPSLVDLTVLSVMSSHKWPILNATQQIYLPDHRQTCSPGHPQPQMLGSGVAISKTATAVIEQSVP